MARVTKKMVKDFLDRERTQYKTDLKQYSQEALIFSFLLGMPPAECEGMYPEESMDRETLRLVDTVDSIIWDLRREKFI